MIDGLEHFYDLLIYLTIALWFLSTFKVVVVSTTLRMVVDVLRSFPGSRKEWQSRVGGLSGGPFIKALIHS